MCGAGIVGLATALMLADDGHQVTVLETDPAPAPAGAGPAWDGWQRRGVAHFRQPHQMNTRFRVVCDEELPDVTPRLLQAGCTWVDFLAALPRTIADRTPKPSDERLRILTGRRPTVEAVFAELAANRAGLTVRRGVRVVGVRTGPSDLTGIPHVTGVVTASGEQLPADLVVDATGRRSPTSQWLREAGTQGAVDESTDLGYVYYTRYFSGARPPELLGRANAAIGSFSLLTLFGDNDVWSITIFGTSNDGPLKAVRDPEVFARVLAACPQHAHWLDGSPIGGVHAMAGVLDRSRRLVIDDQPVATGFVAVGDAWASTNPSAGRGIGIGLLHAQQLRHAVREHLDRPGDLVRDFDKRTDHTVAPYYRNQVGADRARILEMTAFRDGTALPPSGGNALAAAAAFDADVYRGLIEIVMCMAHPGEVLARPEVRAALERHAGAPVHGVPGPDRAQLEKLLAG